MFILHRPRYRNKRFLADITEYSSKFSRFFVANVPSRIATFNDLSFTLRHLLTNKKR